MYAACGAVSLADHEKLRADLDAANEARHETKSDLKKEKACRKEAEKKVEQTEAEIEKKNRSKDILEAEKNKVLKDAEKKSTDLAHAQKQVERLRLDRDKQKQAAEDAKIELVEAKERAEKVADELQRKAAEAEQLAAESARLKAEADAKIEEVVQKVHHLEEEKKEEDIKMRPVWSTGLCSCCARPGGVGLFLEASCCPCLVLGRINASLKIDGSNPCPNGVLACCVGCCCEPCYMRSAALAVARRAGKEEDKCRASCSAVCCPCCYIAQVYRETLIISASGEAHNPAKAPLQESMEAS